MARVTLHFTFAWVILAGSPAVAGEPDAEKGPRACTLDLCGQFLKTGPTPDCKCFGSQPGCCRFRQGCSCAKGCDQFGDCCPGAIGLCDVPHVRAFEPAALPATGGDLTIRGVNLGGAWVRVRIGKQLCPVTEVRSGHIRCKAPPSTEPTEPVYVMVDGRKAAPAEIRRVKASAPTSTPAPATRPAAKP